RMLNVPFDESINLLDSLIIQYYAHPPGTEDDIIMRYMNQDLALLDTAIFNETNMITRNQKMANGIDKIMKDKPVFVIIGAAHLPYEHGVLNLLHQKGYTIKPYPIKVSKK